MDATVPAMSLQFASAAGDLERLRSAVEWNATEMPESGCWRTATMSAVCELSAGFGEASSEARW